MSNIKKQVLTVSDSCPHTTEELRINGLSLIFYDYFILDGSEKLTLENPSILEIKSKNHYNILFNLSSGGFQSQKIFQYKNGLTIPSFKLINGDNIYGSAKLFFQIIADKFLLTTTVVNIDLKNVTLSSNKIHVSKPLKADDVLEMITQLNEPGKTPFNQLAERRKKAIQDCFGLTIHSDSIQSRKTLGIQIWDLENLKIENESPITGIKLLNDFGWEISALLQSNSDLIRKHKEWRRQSKDRIEKLFQNISSVLSDHAVVTNGSICLEISQVNYPVLTERSSDRIMIFGYDSTSIYLWGYLALLEFVLNYYNATLSSMLYQARQTITKQSTTDKKIIIDYDKARELIKTVVNIKTEIYDSLDNVYWITGNMNEQRHVDFFQNSATSLRLDKEVIRIEQKLDQLTSITSDIEEVLLSLDQRDTMQKIKVLTEKTAETNRVLEFLSVVAAIASSVIFTQFLASIFTVMSDPIFQISLTVVLILSILVIYVILRREKNERNQ